VACLSAVVLALAGAAPVAAAPAAAPAPAGQDRFAAIAVEPATAAYGYSFNFSTKAGAKQEAKHQCRLAADVPSNCKTYVWVRNGCAAVAFKGSASAGYTYGAAFAATKRLAKQRARNAAGSGSQTLAWACSG
jgi:hypothetical protein